ncbi:MAG: 3-deoxy-D-manno-octulosonic acid transferase [Thermoanaerobaculia bacterium]
MLLYRLLATSALLAYSPFALLRSLAGRRQLGDIRGRLGRSPYPDLDGGVWVHAVSVGEVGVARSLLRSVARMVPGRRLGLSVTTRAGRELAERTAGEVPVFAFPLELSGAVDRALDSVRPGLVLLTETELWPLFLERARARGVPVALVNGRLSERSWKRYRLIRPWFARVLGHVSRFAMQSERDAERIASLGAPPANIRVTGNLKYDVAAPPPFPDADRIRATARGRPILVAGSTGEGEESRVLEAWKRLSAPTLLALAPRRPERFGSVAAELERRGERVLRRSGPAKPGATVYLLDSIGELASLYREGAIAFLGGSLVPAGGHNPIEAWAAGSPVVVGPSTENFADVVGRGEKLGILRRVADEAGLARAWEEALADPAATKRAGAQAERFVAESRGAADLTAAFVLPLLPTAASRPASRAG